MEFKQTTKSKNTSNPYIIVRISDIHNKGVFAKKFIPQGTEVMEYVGERITKKESETRAQSPLKLSQESSRYGAVYIFELNKRYDIDGNVSYNTARYINHSCEPNCETINDVGHIWITAIRDIEKGEEITYNYGYPFDDDYVDHICQCGSNDCIGYILSEEHWDKVKCACP